MKLYVCEDVKNARWRKNIENEQKVSLAFIKKCVCDFIGEKEYNTEIVFTKNKYGKPYIENIYKTNKTDKSRESKESKEIGRVKIDISIFFSLSHSENILICAVACFNIGADCQIRTIKNAEQCERIAKRFYSDTENMFLDIPDLNNPNNSEAYINNFFKIWTKKEAYIKYTGKGLAEGLQTFSVTNEVRQRNYMSGVYFKRILPAKLKKIKRKDLYIYLCYSKENKNILETKYFN